MSIFINKIPFLTETLQLVKTEHEELRADIECIERNLGQLEAIRDYESLTVPYLESLRDAITESCLWLPNDAVLRYADPLKQELSVVLTCVKAKERIQRKLQDTGYEEEQCAKKAPSDRDKTKAENATVSRIGRITTAGRV